MKNILIIDDVSKESKALSSFFTEKGYDVVALDNASQAAEVLRQNKFDLILCTQNFFFAGQSPLHSIILEDARHAKIIILREEDGELPDVKLHHRIIGVIPKPIDLAKLLKVISLKVHKVGFTGTVKDIDLTDYIQLLSMNKATKAFEVKGTHGGGILVFHHGVLTYATYGSLHGELAFHAIVSMQNGRIIDKQLKRMPQPNINKSLSQLLLETNIHQDERITNAEMREEDFLLEDIPSLEPNSITEEIPLPSAQKERTRTPLFLSLAFFFFMGMAGIAAWQFFPFMQHSEKDVVQEDSTQVSKSELATIANVEKSAPVTDLPPLQQPDAPEGMEKDARKIVVAELVQLPITPQPQPKIILRLHGSNTIGAKLIENLAVSFLVEKYNGKDVTTLTGDDPVEKIVVGTTEGGELVGIQIQAHGSSTSFKDLLAGVCDVGMSSRKIKEKEVVALAGFGDMTASSAEHVLALDGIAVIVHKNNPIRSLSMSDIASIFSGEITSWDELTDGKLTGHINVYARDQKSGTYDTFKGIVLKKTPLIATATRFESNANLSDDVSKDRQGIGFTGLPYIRQSKSVSISDQGTVPIYPNFFTVATEDYPLARRLYLYLPPNTENTIAMNFVDFCLDTSGQLVVEKTGFIDLSIRSFVAALNVDEIPVQNKVIFQQYLDETKSKKRLSLNFRFHPNSIELDNRARRDLDRMVRFLKDQSIEGITLIGFADNRGEYQYNTKLALDRAKVVRNELNSRGIPVTSTISASEEIPVASNLHNNGREKNRRVEIWVQQNRS
ncbi:substrate-binding domain-containing protein [Desulfotalea psychrophila]|nr:substrate-binding domain-containing protein [Desulfocapsa sp.]MBN4071632.1 substrate-binding domain-containing protein [Desulfotalea psychrophila]